MNSCGLSVHRLVARLPLGPIVLPLEGDAALVHREQPAVGDGYAVRVARQVGQHRLRSREGPLGIDHPLTLAQRREPGLEGGRFGQRCVFPEEPELTAIVQPLQFLQEASPEQPRQHAHRQEEPGPASDPLRPIWCPDRRPARCHARAGGGSAPSPKCAAPAWRRCQHPGAWDRLRCAASSRRRCRTASRRAPPCSGTRDRRLAPAA